jgi:ankyrin repeat protein
LPEPQKSAPLHRAASNGHVTVVEALVALRADIHASSGAWKREVLTEYCL